MAPDPTAASAILAGIRERGYRNGATGAECARLSDAAAVDVPLLVAAVEAALKDHRKSMFPAGPPGAGDAYGKHYCAGICCTAVDDQVIYRVWPCQPYQDITAALTGTGKVGSEDG